jgi:hypothetical protein
MCCKFDQKQKVRRDGKSFVARDSAQGGLGGLFFYKKSGGQAARKSVWHEHLGVV